MDHEFNRNIEIEPFTLTTFDWETKTNTEAVKETVLGSLRSLLRKNENLTNVTVYYNGHATVTTRED